MQVSPDKNVRVTQASPIGRIPVSPEYASGLKNGDFLVATVEQIQGDTLLLRVDDGFLLNAELQGNTRLAQGDVIEAAVSKDGGKCLLYILNVLHSGAHAAKGTGASVTPQTLSAMLSVIKKNPGLDADIALFLAENNIPDTAENIAALSQMTRGTGIGELLGRILGLMTQRSETAQSGSPQPQAISIGDTTGSPQGEAIETGVAVEGGKSQPVPGERAQTQASNGVKPQIGTKATVQTPGPGLQTAATGPDTTPVSPGVPHTDVSQGAAVPALTPEQGMETDAVKPGPLPGGQIELPPGSQSTGERTAPEAQTGPLSDTAGTVQPQAEPLAGASGTVPQQAAPQGALINTEGDQNTANIHTQHPMQNIETLPGDQREVSLRGQTQGIPSGAAAPADTAVQTGSVAPGMTQGPDDHIGRLIMELFFQPEEKSGEEAKRMADGVSRGLKTLKSELIQTDIKYREHCLKSVDQALRQIEMADRAAHFEHMQIPLAVKEGEHRTAELYVFRRKNGRKETAEVGLSILVALDTDHMGRVETLIREAGGSISLEFRLQEPDMADILKRSSVPLQKAVEAAGYTLTGMRFAGLEKKTTVLNAGEMVSLDAGSATHGIDVQI